MRALLLASAILLVGCPKKADPGPATSSPGGGAVANAGGQTLPPGACQMDADCVISCARPNECCDQLCEPCEQAWHRDELAAHEAWQGTSCDPAQCPVARCMAPTEETFAVCREGACVVERRPLAP